MRNRAKCKLCNTVVESFHEFDLATCKCGEVAVYGGAQIPSVHCKKKENVILVDDNDNEIMPSSLTEKPKENATDLAEEPPKEVTKKELIEIYETMIKADANLPQQALHAPCTYADLYHFKLFLLDILKIGLK